MMDPQCLLCSSMALSSRLYFFSTLFGGGVFLSLLCGYFLMKITGAELIFKLSSRHRFWMIPQHPWWQIGYSNSEIANTANSSAPIESDAQQRKNGHICLQ